MKAKLLAEKILLIAAIVTAVLMVAATVVIYINFPEPLYYDINGEGTTTTTLEHLNGESAWLIALPAVSCLVFILSVKFGWLSILSALLFFFFWVAASPGGLIDIPKIASGGDAIYFMCAFAFALCLIRLIIMLIRYAIKDWDSDGPELDAPRKNAGIDPPGE